MTLHLKPDPPNASVFIEEVSKLVNKFSWTMRTFEREDEIVCVAPTEHDQMFEQIIWVYDTDRIMLRCLLVGKDKIKTKNRSAVLELCARVNNGLPFGCLEYSFEDDVVVFRDSTDLDWGPLEQLVESITARSLNLGQRYAVAIESVLQGLSVQDAVTRVEE